MFDIPAIPLARWTDAAVAFLVDHFAESTRTFARGMEVMLNGLETALLLLPPWAFIVLACLLVWLLTRRFALPAFVAVGFAWAFWPPCTRFCAS